MVKIRLAKVQDARAIAEVHVRAWQKGDRGIRPDSYLDALSVADYFPIWERILSGMPANEVLLVAESDGGGSRCTHKNPTGYARCYTNMFGWCMYTDYAPCPF